MNKYIFIILSFFSHQSFSQEIHCVNEQTQNFQIGQNCQTNCLVEMPIGNRWKDTNSFLKNPKGECIGENCDKFQFGPVKVSDDGAKVFVQYNGLSKAEIILSGTVCLINQNKPQNNTTNNNEIIPVTKEFDTKELTIHSTTMFTQINQECNNLKISWINQARNYCLAFNGLDISQSKPECASQPIRTSDVFNVVVSGNITCFSKNSNKTTFHQPKIKQINPQNNVPFK